MDYELVDIYLDQLSQYSEAMLFHDATQEIYKDEVRLAAALLLTTCDSNERKAE